MLVSCKPRKLMQKLFPVWLVQSFPAGWWSQDLNFFSFPALTAKDRPQALGWGAPTMVESRVPFVFAALECQQGQTRSAGHSLEHIANTERAATAIAERLCWRCASPTCVPQAVLSSSNTHLSANMSPDSSGLLLLCHLLLWVNSFSNTGCEFGLHFGYFGRGAGGFSAFCCKDECEKAHRFLGFCFCRGSVYVSSCLALFSLSNIALLIRAFVYTCLFIIVLSKRDPAWLILRWSAVMVRNKVPLPVGWLRHSRCVTEVLGLNWNNRWFPIVNRSSLKWPYKLRKDGISF